MSVSLYDEAFKNKIARWVVDPNMKVLGPDETARLFQVTADQTNDKPIELPLIAITRGRDIDIVHNNKRPMSYRGKVFNSDGVQSDHLNAIPIQLKYQLDIYTRYLDEADEYVRNFVFNIINHPKITIAIPYNDSVLHYDSFITLNKTLTDNSDIPQRLIPGQFTRMSLGIEITDAHLFSYNFKKIPRVHSIELETKEEHLGTIIIDNK